MTWSKMNIFMSCYLGVLCPGIVAIDPENPNVVYAGQLGGVARTADGGDTWTVLKSGLPNSFNVTALAIDPESPSALYAMGYDRSPAGRSVSSVFKSADGGNSWVPFGEPLPDLTSGGNLALTSHGYNTLYAGTTSGLYKALDDTPVLSVDSQNCIGRSWQLKVGNAVPNVSIRLSGTSNGQSWELQDWRTTDRKGSWVEVGTFPPGAEGSHYLRVSTNGVPSNVMSFVVSNCETGTQGFERR